MNNNTSVCPLCGTPFLEKDTPCNLCGGKEESFFGIRLGYIYPAETKLIRNFFLFVLVSLIIFAAIAYYLWTYFENTIKIVG